MSTTVRYLKYLLQSTGGKKLVDTDFNEDLQVETEHIAQVIRDLSDFSGTAADPLDYKSEVQVQTNQDVIVINRDYKKQTSNLTSQKQTDPNFFWLPDDIAEYTVNDRNPYVLFPLKTDLCKTQIVKMLHSLNSDKDSDISDNSEFGQMSEIRKKMSEIGAQQLEELVRIEIETQEVESQLAKQRRVDEAQSSVADLESKLDEIIRTLKDVEDLVQAQKKVHTQLRKYSSVMGDDVMQQAEKLRKEIERVRKQKLEYEAEIMSKEKSMQATQKLKNHNKPKFAVFLLILPLILMGMSLIGFFMTYNAFILALGITGGIIESLLFLAINAVEPEVDLDKVDFDQVIAQPESKFKLKEGLRINPQRIKQIEQFFINKAWAEVLRDEVLSLQKAIAGRLEGGNLKKIQQAQAEVQGELNKLRAIIKAHEGKNIPPEEYMKLRRKLDKLKMEKENLNNELLDVEDQVTLSKLQKSLRNLKLKELMQQNFQLPEDLQHTFVHQVTESYLGAKVENNQLMLFSKDTNSWLTERIDPLDLISLYVYLKMLMWQRNPSLPVVLVNVMNKFSGWVRSALYEKINELRTQGQVVIVDPK